MCEFEVEVTVRLCTHSFVGAIANLEFTVANVDGPETKVALAAILLAVAEHVGPRLTCEQF